MSKRASSAVCLAAAMMLAAPVWAQLVPLGQYAQVPDLKSGEEVVGLTLLTLSGENPDQSPTPIAPHLGLITTLQAYFSPLFPGPGELSVVLNTDWLPNLIRLNMNTQWIGNPVNPNEFWVTGLPPRGGPILYRINIDDHTNIPVVSSTVVGLPPQTPASLATDGSFAYLIDGG